MTIRELEAKMKEHNFSQADIAKQLGVNRSSVNRIVNVPEQEKDKALEGWANAALTQYFAFLDVQKRLNVYPITKK